MERIFKVKVVQQAISWHGKLGEFHWSTAGEHHQKNVIRHRCRKFFIGFRTFRLDVFDGRKILAKLLLDINFPRKLSLDLLAT